jgi:hypothetical protein
MPAARGEVDQRAMIDLQPQTVVRNRDGRYRLWRIGDALASRNIHASIYEAMRLCLRLWVRRSDERALRRRASRAQLRWPGQSSREQSHGGARGDRQPSV